MRLLAAAPLALLAGCASVQRTAVLELNPSTVEIYEYNRPGILSTAGVTIVVQDGRVVGVVPNRPGAVEIVFGQAISAGAALGGAIYVGDAIKAGQVTGGGQP